jgi:uncharacterized repeat protein (TIGR01451 family)
MKNLKRTQKLLIAFVMVFTLFGGFGATPLAANVTIGSQTINVGLGAHEVVFSVSVQAGTTVHSAWVTMEGMNAIILDQSLLAGRTFESPESVPITVAVVVDEDHRGATFVGHVGVGHSEGTTTGMLTVSVAAPTPTPTPTPTPAQTPIIHQTAPTGYVEMTPGISSIVSVTLSNNSRFIARDFRVMPRVSADFTVEIVGDLPNFTIAANGSRTFQLRVTPHSGLESGTHTIAFDYSFENNVRDITTQQGSIVARVYRPVPDEPRVVMADFALTPGILNAGDDFTITAALRNTSSANASNVQLSVGGFGESGLISRGSTTSFVGDVSAGATREISFDFGTGTRMNTGSYPIVFTLRHDNSDGEVVTENFTFYVTVMGDGADAETDRARLAITNISPPTGIFSPGEQAHFEITVRNNGERDAANIRISAAPEEGVVPRLASIQTLPALEVGQSYTFSFAFAPTSSARSQFYNIGFGIAYDTGQTDDGVSVRGSFEQFSGFNVYNPDADEDEDEDGPRSVPRIIISDYTVEPLIVMANTEFDLSLTMLNTHSERTIGNIRVTWEVAAITVGNETTGGNVFTPVDSSNTFFIDSIPPRGTYEHHMRLFAIPDAAPRNHVIIISFDYEDAEGNPFEATENIGVNVRQQSRLELSMMPGIPTMVMEGDRIDVSVTALNAGRSTLFNLRVRLEGEGITPTEEVFGNVQSGNMNNFWANFFATQPGHTTVYLIANFEDEMGEAREIVQAFDMEVMGMGGGDWDGGGFDRFPEGGGDFSGFRDDDSMWHEEEDGGFWTNIWFWVGVGGGVIVAAGAIILLVRRKRKRDEAFALDDDELS